MPERMDLQRLRSEARALVRANDYAAVKTTALFLALSLLLSEIRVVSDTLLGKQISLAEMSISVSYPGVLASLLALVLHMGYQHGCLRLHRGEQPGLRGVFVPLVFAGQAVLLQLLRYSLMGFGLTLFFLPGLYFALVYALAPLALCEEPEKKSLAAMRRSRERMRGYKLALFVLMTGFLPYVLLVLLVMVGVEMLLTPLLPDSLVGVLACLTCENLAGGCLRAFLQPYIALSFAGFYRCVMEERVEA